MIEDYDVRAVYWADRKGIRLSARTNTKKRSKRARWRANRRLRKQDAWALVQSEARRLLEQQALLSAKEASA